VHLSILEQSKKSGYGIETEGKRVLADASNPTIQEKAEGADRLRLKNKMWQALPGNRFF
jgi:hypothetical protein